MTYQERFLIGTESEGESKEFMLFTRLDDNDDDIWNESNGIMVWVFAIGPGDRGSILDRVIPKTPKMVLDATLFNTQHYKVQIKGKVEQSRERSSAHSYTSV